MAEFWWREALCAEVGAELFFGHSTDISKAACRICPVREQCLAAVLVHDEPSWGVVGGFDQRARRRLKRKVDAGQDPASVAMVAVAREKRGLT